MKTFLPKKTPGFTLIELLIVIALLGALAIGLLATIDPFEQLKKGRDTSLRNTVSEFYNANLRYYSTKGEFPWGTAGLTDTSGATSTLTVDLLTDTVVTALVNSGELKNRFSEIAGSANLAKIHITSTDATHMVSCFEPESKSFQIDKNTVYNSAGDAYDATDVPTCKSLDETDPNSISCFYCIQ